MGAWALRAEWVGDCSVTMFSLVHANTIIAGNFCSTKFEPF